MQKALNVVLVNECVMIYTHSGVNGRAKNVFKEIFLSKGGGLGFLNTQKYVFFAIKTDFFGEQ